MFIKKYESEKGTFYTLTIINVNDDNKKTKFITCFIPEKFAEALQRFGIEIKTKESK